MSHRFCMEHCSRNVPHVFGSIKAFLWTYFTYKFSRNCTNCTCTVSGKLNLNMCTCTCTCTEVKKIIFKFF